MSDAFWANLPMLITAIFGGVGGIVAAVWARQAREVSKDKATEIKVAIAENTALTSAVKQAAVRSKDEMETNAAGAGRQAVEEFKRAATVPGALRTDFDPAATDLGHLS